jgi:hypothetical protein
MTASGDDLTDSDDLGRKMMRQAQSTEGAGWRLPGSCHGEARIRS